MYTVVAPSVPVLSLLTPKISVAPDHRTNSGVEQRQVHARFEMSASDRAIKAATGRSDDRARKNFFRSLQETAARAVVTATVTFAVGLVLKKMFEKSVADAAQEGARSGVSQELSQEA